jgi:outer membrane protein TolC
MERRNVRREENRRKFWVTLAMVLMTVTAKAQVSLATVVDMAQQNSASVRLAQADIQRADASLAQVFNAYIPNFSIGSEVGYSYGFPTGQPSVGSASMQSLVLSFSQRQYIKAARAALDAANLKLKDAREEVALEVSTAYIELDTVKQELDAAAQQESLAGKMVEIEKQRTEAGVDPLSDLLQAQLAAAQTRLKRFHLETRSATLARQLSTLTGLPAGSIAPEHASIPEIPSITADEQPRPLPSIQAAGKLALSKQLEAHGDDLTWRRPQVAFGAIYNYDSSELNSYTTYYHNFTPNNVSFGLQINIPFFDFSLRAKARATAAEALRATVEAEEAQQKNDLHVAELTGSLRELNAQAEIAGLQQQIAQEQLKSVLAQLELGSGSPSAPGAATNLSPQAEQQARIDERQKVLDSMDASLDLSKARLNLLRALGHMQDWLDELRTPSPSPSVP